MKESEKSSKAKFFIIFLLIMAAGIGVYFYLPKSGFADQARAFVELALNGTKQQVRGFIDAKILPKDPEAQRKELIGKLKTNLEQLKNKTSPGAANNNKNSTSTAALSGNTSVSNLINSSENIINQLETANGNTGVVQTAVERILDLVLPIKEKAIECKN